MGLDMYLFKSAKVAGLTVDDYIKADNLLQFNENNPYDPNKLSKDFPPSLIHSIAKRGTYFTWYSIFEEIGYWRKANAIHRWFVDNVQGGLDECQFTIVEKENIETLLSLVNEVLDDNDKASSLLPTQGGFFFGGTDYDGWYYKDLENTRDILTNVLNETDWDEEVVFYSSSW